MTFSIGKSHTRGAGYLINGVNETRPYEADILTCAHCQKVLQLHLWRDDGGWCRREMKPLCGPCADLALVRGCEPFLKTLEAFTREQYRLAQMEKAATVLHVLSP